MTYLEFAARWQPAGGAERANYALFLTDLCDLLGVPRPDATTDNPAQDAYVLERAVTFDDGAGKRSTGRIDLYKRGCFVLETKQGVGGFVDVLGEEPLPPRTLTTANPYHREPLPPRTRWAVLIRRQNAAN